MKTNWMVLGAKVLSTIFSPLYFPLLCMLVLMGFSYMRAFPINYQVTLLLLVYLLTIGVPQLLIMLYRKTSGIHGLQWLRKEARVVPYVICIVCYYLCYHIMTMFVVPHFVISVVIASILVPAVCLVINTWFKVSVHSAAAGAMVGALVAFAHIFGFNPVWWLCLTLIIAGCVGTSRLILRRHTLAQVLVGLATGLVVGFAAIMLF